MHFRMCFTVAETKKIGNKSFMSTDPHFSNDSVVIADHKNAVVHVVDQFWKADRGG